MRAGFLGAPVGSSECYGTQRAPHGVGRCSYRPRLYNTYIDKSVAPMGGRRLTRAEPVLSSGGRTDEHISRRTSLASGLSVPPLRPERPNGEPSQTPSASIVISHLNSIRTISRCVRALAHQSYDASRYEIVVVDAGSSDGSIEAVKALGIANLRLIVDVGCSEPRGQSVGAESSESDLVFFTNSDIYTPPDWIERHVGWHLHGYDLVGGRYFWGGDKFAYAWNTPRWEKPDQMMAPGRGVGFGNCSVGRELYRKCGGVRDLASHQDIDFMLRALNEGGRILVDPDIVVYHDHPFGSLRGSLLRSSGYTTNHVAVIRSFRESASRASGVAFSSPTMVAGDLLRELLGVTGVRAYRETRDTAAERGIVIGLTEFLYLRYSARELGYLLGLLRSVFRRLRRQEEYSIQDLHRTPKSSS